MNKNIIFKALLTFYMPAMYLAISIGISCQRNLHLI